MTLPVRRSAGQADRWNPFRGFEELYQQIDRLAQSASGTAPDGGPWLPAGDVSETDDAYLVEIELPGVRRDDIDVELYGNELVVTGELKEVERKGLLRRRTRRVGEFEYRVTLPGDIRADGIGAALDSGVLTVRVPKVDATKPSKIKITGG
ncbi:Hsp20/alpha crystallin family protein [Amycolatopsis sp. NPDC004378]